MNPHGSCEDSLLRRLLEAALKAFAIHMKATRQMFPWGATGLFLEDAGW